MRKRVKRHIAWGPVLWILLVVNCAAGIMYSPVTAIRDVRVVGVEKAYEKYVKAILGKQLGRPAMQVDPDLIESEVLASSAVRETSFARNILGRATLIVRYRKPVARFESDRNLYLDEDGAVFRSINDFGELPTLDIFADALQPTLSLSGRWPTRRIAFLAKASTKYDFGPRSTVEVQANGAVSLITDSAVTIRLGSPYSLEAKLQKLDELMASHPDLLLRAASIQLTAPEYPKWTPKREPQKP